MIDKLPDWSKSEKVVPESPEVSGDAIRRRPVPRKNADTEITWGIPDGTFVDESGVEKTRLIWQADDGEGGVHAYEKTVAESDILALEEKIEQQRAAVRRPLGASALSEISVAPTDWKQDLPPNPDDGVDQRISRAEIQRIMNEGPLDSPDNEQ
ncbi:MAG: hypothetical protein JWM07_838 [Candidatus Saccharibacteria bacterium]|nr:hypothetical protein [Candidatus Saccharibacteria bacterium]